MTALVLALTVLGFVALVVVADHLNHRAEHDRQSDLNLRRELSRHVHPSSVEWPDDDR